jgi:LCP family protein required for cell wall assembly
MSSVVGVAILILTNVLPGWALIASVMGDLAAATAIAAILGMTRPKLHRKRFWVLTGLSVLLVIANLTVVKVGADYLKFGEVIQAPPASIIVYDIVVLTTSVTSVTPLAGTAMGETQGDPYSDAVHAKVQELVTVSFDSFSLWSEMVSALTAGDIPSMVIRDGYMQVLSDADVEVYDQLRILASFEIEGTAPTASPTHRPSVPPPPQYPYIIYISGIDTFGPISSLSRSDVNILMVVNPDTGKILLVNTPRDFYVQLRDTTGLKDKLTHAGVYGIDVSQGTMEDLYEVPIDYYLRINFNSLVAVVNALGGVDVESVYDFTSNGHHFVVGMNHLDGPAALAFSRARYNFPEGDRIRGQNQQRVIEAIVHKLSDPSVLVGYNRILSAVQGAIQTSMPPEVISSQVKHQLTTGQSWTTTSISVNGSDASEYTYTYPGQRLYVMVPDDNTVYEAKLQIQAILSGQ